MLPTNKEKNLIHSWLIRKKGKATKCQHPKCAGFSKRVRWYKKHDANWERKVENFISLCENCRPSKIPEIGNRLSIFLPEITIGYLNFIQDLTQENRTQLTLRLIYEEYVKLKNKA